MNRVAVMDLILAAAVAAALAGCQGRKHENTTGSALEISVPAGDGLPVMTDGIIQPGEWADAKTVEISDKVSLFFKQYQGHLFVGVDARRLVSPSVDLFFTKDSINIIDLHASAQLGELLLIAGSPDSTDPICIWGKTAGWYANEVRWMYRLQDSLMKVEGKSWAEAFQVAGFPHEMVEFDILQSKFGTLPCLFRMEIMNGEEGDSVMAFPAGTVRKDPRNWAKLVIK